MPRPPQSVGEGGVLMGGGGQGEGGAHQVGGLAAARGLGPHKRGRGVGGGDFAVC